MIFLSLGSNLSSLDGKINRFKNIDNAIKAILSKGYVLIKKSNYYETPSYPNNNYPKFINVVISLKEKNSITIKENLNKELMGKIFQIESSFGRQRKKKNDPRTIDIDIIDYDKKTLEMKLFNSEMIKIPHERLSLRNFVLFPLKEICPNWIHPVTRKSIDELIDGLSEINKKSILKVEHS